MVIQFAIKTPSGFFSMTKEARSDSASVRDAMLASREKSQNLPYAPPF
ncbi:MAG: hypothetical protein L6Q59_11735 [Ignavibacteriaceae bacterium]|nr:hypothetical protein [Ignavibacteriaceae bacterium]